MPLLGTSPPAAMRSAAARAETRSSSLDQMWRIGFRTPSAIARLVYVYQQDYSFKGLVFSTHKLRRPSWSKATGESFYGTPVPGVAERLAEHGWKPHRVFLGSKKLITGLDILVYAWTTGGTVSSNSRFQAASFQRYSAKLSVASPPSRAQRSAKEWRFHHNSCGTLLPCALRRWESDRVLVVYCAPALHCRSMYWVSVVVYVVCLL